MINQKFTLVLAITVLVSACGTDLNEDMLLGDLQNSTTVSTLSTNFTAGVEPENQEILIDEDYYKAFPDASLADQVYNNVVTGTDTPVTAKPVDEIKAQSLLSIFNKKVTIDIYDSFGSQQGFYVTGRAYKKKSISPANTSDSFLKNLFRNIKYFTPDGLGNTDVSVSVNGVSQNAKTDSKGYFKAVFNSAPVNPGVNQVSAKLLTNKYKFDIPQEQLVIDNSQSDKVGIISDIDDTVKFTGVDNKLKMVKHILSGNYKTDKAIPGVSTLYKGILTSPMGTGFDCMHYVTGSPAHLYTRIQDFLTLNRFPQGSVDLQKLGSKVDPIPKGGTLEYKLSRMRPIMKAFPNKKFIMFGDTTQQDTEVYSQLKKEFPQNVLSIYINNVNKQDQSNPRFQDVLLTTSAIESAQDLLSKGVITQETLDKVISEVR